MRLIPDKKENGIVLTYKPGPASNPHGGTGRKTGRHNHGNNPALKLPRHRAPPNANKRNKYDKGNKKE